MIGSVIWGVMGDGGSGTLKSVGMALGLSFFPPAGDLAISSNWLSSKWSCKNTRNLFYQTRLKRRITIFSFFLQINNKQYRHVIAWWPCRGAEVYKLAWHNLEHGVGTKSRRQLITHFLLRTGSLGNRKSCFPIVVEFEQFGAEHPPISLSLLVPKVSSTLTCETLLAC